MLELRLHGALGRDFGTTWSLEVSSVKEAMQALCAMVPRFRRAVMTLDQTGMVFRVRTKTQDLGEQDLSLNLGDTKRVDVIPIVRGSSAAGRFIAGAVLVIVGAIYGYYSEDWSSASTVMEAGVGLMLGSVAELLAPHPKKEQFKDDIKSWTINGPLNTVDQGNPVPVIYGEVLTGGVPISAGITTAYVAPAAGSLAPVATIGGDTDESFRMAGPISNQQIQLRYSVSTLNFVEPFGALTYSWSVTGFSASTIKTISGDGTATIIVMVTYDISTQGITPDTAVVSCHVTGYDNNASFQSCDGHLTATIYLDTRVPDWN